MNNRINAVLCTATVLGLGAAALAVPTTAAQAAAAFKPLQFSASVVHERVILDFGTEPLPKDLKVHLRKKGTTARVATVTGFTAAPEGVQTAPLKLAALGEYAVDVEYDGPQGEPVSHKDKTSLNYQVRPSFTNLKASKPVSLADPQTVVSGDIKLYDPRNGALKPYPGTFTARTGTVTTPVTPDAQGHFASKITVNGAESGAKAVDHDATYVHLAGEANGIKDQESLPVAVTSAATARITPDSPDLTGPFGTNAKVGGTVTWKAPDGTWKPAPVGMRIAVDRGSAPAAYVTTDGAGRFEGSFPFPANDDDPWRVRTDSPWASAPEQSLTVNTTGGTSFSDFTANLYASGAVFLRAKLNLVEIPSGTARWADVDIQHSADGKTGWTTINSASVRVESGNSTEYLNPTIRNPGPGFLRLQFADTPDIRGSVTPAVRLLDRKATAISDFNAAPEPVKKGQPITVTGKLTEADAARKPVVGATVHYYFKASGTTAWKAMGSTRTLADGSFSRKFPANVTGTWITRYVYVTTPHFYSSSREDEVVVTP
ncbi:hypothetical protein ACE1OC_23825 [Streptomyces sp. DSM 116496]|uniref:hypothetical protein n=1 Tax=Streptomyces stoeckheimensis TaxID=3344656 RepID=UPI0038B278FA